MRTYLSMTLLMILIAAMLTGCAGNLDADTDTIYIAENGSVQSIDTGLFNQTYYDFDELKLYVEESVQEISGGDTSIVKVVEFKETEDRVKLSLKYQSPQYYEEFNGMTLFSGSVTEALNEEYDFDTVFYSVTDGEKGEELDRNEVINNGTEKIVIIEADVNVKVDGKITVISGEHTKVLDRNLAEISTDDEGESSELTYIIYQ
ncbi:MAG: hypothetical protein ACK5ML_09360 [Lachnospiraceae bacterium]